MINVYWHNRLESLAARMFDAMARAPAAAPAELLRMRRCVVIPNRMTQYWLQHEFLFRPGCREVLTNIEFSLVNVFVNDCLGRMEAAPQAAPRDPEAHPFSREALAWRILRLLEDAAFLRHPACAPLRDFLEPPARAPRGGAATANPARRFKLATRLATLFDEYMVYRPEMLCRWEQGEARVPDPRIAWQPLLWNALTQGDLRRQTYLASFQRMRTELHACALQEKYDRIRVFHVSMLPCVYIHFFERLSAHLPVDFHLLNPSEALWFDPSAAPSRESPLQGRLDSAEDLFEPRNPFLGQQGRGNRNFLVELLDRTGGQAEAEGAFTNPGADTLLHALQAQILENHADPCDGGNPEASVPPALRSVQLHVCHSPLREVQVLHDHLLRWFFDDPSLQPRQVQVLVSDMATYAPYIQAVFAAPRPDAPDAIPYAMADRVAASESTVALAFLQLLNLADSRFTAPEVLDLLHCEAVRAAFGLDEPAVAAIQEWVARAGIRWGRSRQHRQEVVEVAFEDYTTWRRGLDRLLLGYAYGRAGEQAARDGDGELPEPCDCVEGDDAVTLGRFISLTDALESLADHCATPHPPAAWAGILDGAIDTCFAGDENTYHEIRLIRNAVDRLRKSSGAASFSGMIGIDVVRNFLTRHLQDVLGGDFLGGNVVVFSALRPGGSLPRRIIGLLGMGDGAFPRSDNRPAYDILRMERRFGDRSLRLEDRMAFLETVLNARERLYVSYPGLSPEDNRHTPPSVVVSEWMDALALAAGAAGRDEGSAGGVCPPVEHRLQPHHADYFLPGGGLFSYAAEAARTARALLERKATPPSAPSGATPPGGGEPSPADGAATPATHPPRELELEELIRFFRNPAEAYFKNVLGVRLDLDQEAALEEAETFQPGGLDEYAINRAIVSALAAAPEEKSEHVRQHLLEQGRLPLGQRGRIWFAQQWEAIAAFLDQDLSGCGTLRELVRRQDGAEALRRALPVPGAPGAVLLTGRWASFSRRPDDGARLLLDFRYVRDKAQDRLAAWLRHLFACAAGAPLQGLCVRRDKDDAPAVTSFPVVSPDAALAALGHYCALYLRGQQAPLMFEIDCSAAYARAIWNAKSLPAEEKALQDARGKWEPYQGRRPCDDVYCQAAFGAQGPCDRPDFGATALEVFPEEPALTP